MFLFIFSLLFIVYNFNMEKTEVEPELLWDYIKYLREKNNYELNEFARRIDCSYFHATMIEREYHLAKRTASPELLKSIARVCSKNTEERKQIEHKLLLRRARIFFQKEVAENTFADLTSESFIVSDSMPKPFIERLEKDINTLEDKNAISKLSITKIALDAVLNGRYLLSHRKVSEMARRFKQPEDEYLILAGYIPESLRKIIDNEHFRDLLEKAKHLNENDIERLGIALSNMLILVTTNDNKKKEG